MLPEFPIASYRFSLRVIEPLTLPLEKGNVLRGGFGCVFRRTVCAQPERKRCVGCLLQHQCAYGLLFEPSPPPNAEVLQKNEAIPRPFLIEPPLEGRSNYELDESLEFGLVLIGRAVKYLPYFVAVFEELGRRGIGPNSGRLSLELVTAETPWSRRSATVYASGVMYNPDLVITTADIEEFAMTLSANRLTLDFLTPARLKHKGRWVRDGPPFHILVKALLGRSSSLSYFHCGQQLEADFRGLIDRAAEGVHIAQCQTDWQDWSRFSGRQKQRVEMGGLVGRVTYEGDLSDYLPLLALGELVHVGKGTVFGNGKYAISQASNVKREASSVKREASFVKREASSVKRQT